MCAFDRYDRPESRSANPRPEFDLPDRGPDPALDELTELAAMLCLADYAYLGWMDLNRIWFKSCYGFSALDQPRASSACHWVVDSGQPLLIPDAGDDLRFPPGGIELAGEHACRAYLGVPLYAEDHRVIGTLAVLSRQPGGFRQDHVPALELLARQVTARLDLSSRIRAQENAQRARQRAERTLAVERSFFAATLDSVPALVAVLDTTGRVIRFNQPCVQFTGLSVAEAAGRSFMQEILREEDWQLATLRLHDALTGRISGPHETMWRASGGLARHVRWTVRPLAGTDSEIQYVIVSGQDTTEQREAEKALLTSESRYRQIVESSLGFIFTCTVEGYLTSLNGFTAETLGYRMEELIGRSVTELLDSSGASKFRDCLHALEVHDEWQGAIPVRYRDGIFRYIAFRSRRVDLHGERPFLLHHGVDVTEQHDAEEALRFVMRQHELILESVGEGIYGIDLDGHLTFLNPAGARALGYEPRELVGRDILDVIHHCSADGAPYSRATSPILEAMRKGQTLRMQNEIFWRADGSPIPVEYMASPLIEDGLIMGMVVAFQDVSERHGLEKMKDEFISTVSHELRTPLTALRASLGLLSSASMQKHPEKQREMIEMAIGNCDRLARLVNDILDFDRVQRGRMGLRRVPIAAIDLLRRAVDAAQAAASEKQIGFRIEAQTEYVLADEDRALQVLNELITNAIKFSPPATLIRLGALPSGEAEVRFMVEDQGSSIAPEKLPRIFDRFQQGDASDARPLGGTGLGLALCRSIVEQHGGQIWAESTPGRGTRVYFTLLRATSDQCGRP